MGLTSCFADEESEACKGTMLLMSRKAGIRGQDWCQYDKKENTSFTLRLLMMTDSLGFLFFLSISLGIPKREGEINMKGWQGRTAGLAWGRGCFYHQRALCPRASPGSPGPVYSSVH